MREADESFFDNQVTRNKYVWAALVFCISAIAVAYFIPQVSPILSVQDLQPLIWALIGISSILQLIIIQSLKPLTQNNSRF